MNKRGQVEIAKFYDAVAHTSMTWQAVQLAKCYFVDGERITKLISRTGHSAQRVQGILKRVDIELNMFHPTEVVNNDNVRIGNS